MKIPFVGSSSTARSSNASCQRTVNCYLELNDDSPRAPVALYGTPGLTLRETLSTSPNRGGISTQDGSTYVVSGDHVYQVTSAYVVTDCGAIGTTSGRVGMASNGTEVLIVDGVSGWLVTGTTLTQITDVDFPSGVTQATYQDGFFLVVGDGTQKVYWSEIPNSGAAWNGLDFASAEGSPDTTVGCVSDGRVVWLFGAKSTEPWAITENADQLFAQDGNTFIDQGTASAWTAVKLDSTVYWLGANELGKGIVFRAEGYSPKRVSDHELETEIAGYEAISDAYAFALQIAGHSWYVLTFPTANKTWVYDASTGKWFQWMWRDPANNTEHRHRSSWCAFNGDKHLVGDWESGEVYSLELDVYTDNGDPIRRIRRTQTMRSDKRLFFGMGTIDMETAVANADCADPQVMLRYSNDDGHTWSNEKILSLGAVGEYGKRVRIPPTGASKPGRGRVWELAMTDPVPFSLFGADVDVTEGG
jgi:hypothetical protein